MGFRVCNSKGGSRRATSRRIRECDAVSESVARIRIRPFYWRMMVLVHLVALLFSSNLLLSRKSSTRFDSVDLGSFNPIGFLLHFQIRFWVQKSLPEFHQVSPTNGGWGFGRYYQSRTSWRIPRCGIDWFLEVKWSRLGGFDSIFFYHFSKYWVFSVWRFFSSLSLLFLCSFPFPWYKNVQLSLALSPRIISQVANFKPDVIHATSPGVMVWWFLFINFWILCHLFNTNQIHPNSGNEFYF